MFSKYFRDAGFSVGYVEAKGSLFPVQTYFLEDILRVRRGCMLADVISLMMVMLCMQLSQLTRYADIDEAAPGSGAGGGKGKAKAAITAPMPVAAAPTKDALVCATCKKSDFGDVAELAMHAAFCFGDGSGDLSTAGVASIDMSDLLSDLPSYSCEQCVVYDN